MIYYLDTDYRLHVEQDGTRKAWDDETGIFDGKCKTYIEGFRVIPEGESWKRNDGTVFKGFMISHVVDASILHAAQADVEAAYAEMEDMRSALELLGVTPIE